MAVENAENKNIGIDTLVTTQFTENWESTSGLIKDHLQNISNCLLSRDRDSEPVSLLITLGQVIEEKVVKYNPQDLQHIQLKLSGLIRIESQNILIANNFYLSIFNKMWIQNQLIKLPKSWFPQGDLQEMIYVAPPSPLIQSIVSFIETRKMIIVTALCLLFIDVLSLYSSYYLLSSPAWITHFNQNGKGAFIDFIRSFFLISFAAFSFNDLFKTETKQILTYDRHWWIRTCLAVLCFLFMIFVSIYHLYLGPKYLAEKQPLSTNISWFQSYLIPYLCFLPYSIISFVIIGIPLISVTIYSSITNISNNIKRFKIFDKSMEKTNNYIQIFHSLSPSDKEDINEEMLRTFEELSTNFYKDFTRYSILFTGVVLLFIFELTLGRSTLADAPLALTLIDYSFCWVSIIIIFFCGGIEYQKTFKKACNLLERTGGDASQFKTTHNLSRLIMKGASNIRNNKYVCFMMFFLMIFSIVLYHR